MTTCTTPAGETCRAPQEPLPFGSLCGTRPSGAASAHSCVEDSIVTRNSGPPSGSSGPGGAAVAVQCTIISFSAEPIGKTFVLCVSVFITAQSFRDAYTSRLLSSMKLRLLYSIDGGRQALVALWSATWQKVRTICVPPLPDAQLLAV
ncbi:hypothetical protein DQ04_04001070 [Trypanosoma grayi]|uniref:hypothetical protein n=1 Tax=Trypanosoma grayi TaxID=71804 RepID=UPI0004F44947|nr:hypothetical protein DQ04_04001070 [Trypanosoma grayi]KEG10242.1 hypothetical protein DQ04_04001070 [Trypanosoma grayi]